MAQVRVPQALPISLATVSLAPATRAAVIAINAAPVLDDSAANARGGGGDPGVGDGVSCAAPSTSFLGDAEQSLSGAVPSATSETRTEKAHQQQDPPLQPAQT